MTEPLTVEQVAERYKTTPDHVRRSAAEGKLPAFKPARRWLFNPEMLDKYEKGEWRSTNAKPAEPGGSSSHLAERLFAEAAERETGSSRRTTKPRSVNATGGRRS